LQKAQLYQMVPSSCSLQPMRRAWCT